ncbi:HNH endonuclease [Streptomyces sp. NPDC058471]|uniref:HNH endonuclease n=1 Tax=Streptomyces sp. NPDC058471 TaxID=3346516 RepID=UPI003660275E
MGVSGTRQRANRRNRLYERQGGRCAYCGHPMNANVTFEHVWPKSLGGTQAISNGLAVHGRCNRRKASKPPTIGIYLEHPHLVIPQRFWA